LEDCRATGAIAVHPVFSAVVYADSLPPEAECFMVYRSSPKAIMVCMGFVSAMAVGLLAYAGVFDGILQAIAPTVYEFLRALNHE